MRSAPNASKASLVVGYPRPDQTEATAPAPPRISRPTSKYKRDPIAPQSMAAYVGVQMLIEAIGAAGSVDMEKVRAAAAKMDKPAKQLRDRLRREVRRASSRTRALFRRWCSGSRARSSRCSRRRPRSRTSKLVNMPRK